MKKVFKIIGYTLVGILAIVAAGVIYMQYAFPNVDAAPAITIKKTPEMVVRGEYLANHVAVCIDCHSSRDWSLFAGPLKPGTHGQGGDRFDQTMGFPGVFYAKNITPDKETGIGSWTDGEIYRAITAGVNKDGDPIFPMMPYNAYSQMSEQDIYSIIAYLRTLKPIKNEVPKSDPDFPFNLILRTLPGAPNVKAEPVLNDQVSRGKYLVTVAACVDCHTPQESDEKMKFAGGAEFNLPFGTIRSANITPDKETGIGSWTEDAFVNRFKMHLDPEVANRKLEPTDFNSIMPWNMYAGMKEEDLKAIYQYLRTLEPQKNKVVKFTPAPAKS
ncbi:c-type cytochrome [Pontibacter sp. KCTC 32443]|uniref:c-type cytochrome n=1 Tax=Pontibacter TaxID=323449 RepID=UPI00164E92D9|nr:MULTISPECIES: cytochrome c [Pontibacter]MBC5773750.1 c-type cytochrome [Pontibacter sp. KCTC 32443]